MSVYSEVVAESAFGYHRDRVLDTLQNPDLDLPYNLDTIKISHNAVSYTHLTLPTTPYV